MARYKKPRSSDGVGLRFSVGIMRTLNHPADTVGMTQRKADKIFLVHKASINEERTHVNMLTR